MNDRSKEADLIPFRRILVKIARGYILKRLYSAKAITPREAERLKEILKKIEKALNQLLHIKSLIEKILRKDV